MFEIHRRNVAPGSARGLNELIKVHCQPTREVSRPDLRSPELWAFLVNCVLFPGVI